jgi:aldehyde dehydrogenase (NAD+)
MAETAKKRINDIFKALGAELPAGGLAVTTPADGSVIAELSPDTTKTLEEKITLARSAQGMWMRENRTVRADLLEAVSAAIKKQREPLAELIHLDGGKTMKEALGEVDGSAEILLKTIKDASLPELNGMLRVKERPPVGTVALITSFNFPLVVANWTIAPALLAANAVLWKPSEKTPLVALAYKAIFDKAAPRQRNLLHVIVGARDVGTALVAHEGIDMISATGSVAMGQGIKAQLAAKKNNAVKPILELGGNNGIIISEKVTQSHLAWSLTSMLNSFLGTTGQRCTNTRRLIIHRSQHDKAVDILKRHIEAFLASATYEEYGYGPLIDADAHERFSRAKKRVIAEGGSVLFGARLYEERTGAHYVEPALALLPSQTAIMHEETFAPILFITPYDGDIDAAIALVNAPANAGLVNGIYTQNQQEADRFAALNEAGHSVINSPKGTGTPAFGMGFGGKKESGEGEILNAADPLRPFTCDTHYRRIAQNKDIALDQP